LANRPSAQFANSTNKNNPQALEIATALFQAKKGHQQNKPPSCRNQQDLLSIFSHDLLNARKQKKILPTSYLRGQYFNDSSTKHRAQLSRN
jgi:hypothetical protein